MKSAFKIWPIVIFAIGLFFLYNQDNPSVDSERIDEKPLAGKLDVIKLDIPKSSSDALKEQLKTFPRIQKEYVDAEIDGHKVKIKFHGTAQVHFSGKQKSYRIKISKKDSFSIDGVKKLQLIKYGEADPAMLCANAYAKELGLMAPVGRMVDVHVNGINHGAFYLVEHHDKDFFKRHGFKDVVLLAQTTNWFRKEVYQRNMQHATPFDFDIEHLEQKDHPNFTEAMLAYKRLGNYVKSNQVDSIKQLMNLDYMAKFMTSAALFNEIHFLTGDNMKWMYDFDSKKLYPYYRQESGGKLLPDEQQHNFADFDSHLFNHSLTRYGVAENLKVFKLLLMDDSFRNLRNEVLNKELTSGRFDRLCDSIFQYKNFPVLQDHKQLEEQIYNRMKRLAGKYVNYGHIYGTYHKKRQVLSLFADAFCPIQITDGNGNVIKTIQPIKMNESLTYETYKYELDLSNNGNSIDHKDLVFTNTITGKQIKAYDIMINQID